MKPQKKSIFDLLIETELTQLMDQKVSSKNLESSIMQTIEEKTQKSQSWKNYFFGFFEGATVSYALAVIILLVIGYAMVGKPHSISIQSVTGTPQSIIVNGSPQTVAEKGLRLKKEAIVQTMQSQLVIALSAKSQLLFDSQSEFKVVDSNNFDLNKGRLYYWNDDTKRKEILFHTSLGTFQPLGTEFELSISDKDKSISVFEGSVLFKTGNKKKMIYSGQKLTLGGETLSVSPVKRPLDAWYKSGRSPWTDYARYLYEKQ